VNDGGDEGWVATSDTGLIPVEQLVKQIVASDDQVNLTMPLPAATHKAVSLT
jgi:hypothetical protein